MKGAKVTLTSGLTSCAVSLALCSTALAAEEVSIDDIFAEAPAEEAAPASEAAVVAAPLPAESAQTPAAPAPADAEAAVAAPATSSDDATLVAAEKPKARKGRLVEEIVVTAQKREENLSDVPISVQAFSPAALEARGITNTAGLQRATPGLDIGSNAGFTTIFLRGVGTEAFLTADPSIANYIDGVYYPFSPSFSQEFGAVTRVEVLKGPQGTLFGRNAVGGAINILTKEPNFEEPATEVSSSIGNFNSFRSSVYTNVPVTDKLAFNVSGFYTGADAYFKGSTSASKPLERELAYGLKAKVRYAPIEELDFVLGFTKTHAQNNSDFPINLNPTPLGRALLVPPAGPYTGFVDENLYLNSEIQVLQFEGRYKGPYFDVKLLASDQYDSQPFNYDFDGSERPLVSFDILGHYADIQEAELQLLSNQGSPFSEWLTVTAGVFYFENRQGFSPITLTVANLDPANLAAAGVVLPPELADFVDGIFGVDGLLPTLVEPVLGPGFSVPFYAVQSEALAGTKSISEYLQLTAKFTDWVSLTVGARYQNEKRRVIDSTAGIRIPSTDILIGLTDFNQARGQNGELVPNKDTTKKFTPKVALDFHPFRDDTLIYLSYQEAVKASAFNTFAIYLPPQRVEAEETTAYEIGIKTRLFNDTLSLSAAAFNYEIKNLQTQFVSLINGGAVSFENAGKARIRGIDFDTTFTVFPDLIDGLEGSVNGAWLQTAKYLSYDSGSGFNETTGLFSGNNDFTGNRITRSPKFTASTAITKTWSIPGGPIEIGADYYYNSGFFYSASNARQLEQKQYNTVGAHVSYEYEPWNLRASFSGTNVLDEFYTSGVIGTDFGTNYHVAAPLQYAFKLNWTF